MRARDRDKLEERRPWLLGFSLLSRDPGGSGAIALARPPRDQEAVVSGHKVGGDRKLGAVRGAVTGEIVQFVVVVAVVREVVISGRGLKREQSLHVRQKGAEAQLLQLEGGAEAAVLVEHVTGMPIAGGQRPCQLTAPEQD